MPTAGGAPLGLMPTTTPNHEPQVIAIGVEQIRQLFAPAWCHC
jgi:hypothetical protein